MIHAMLAAYDLTPPVTTFTPSGAGINNQTVGVRSGDGAFIWKVYRMTTDGAALRYQHRLLTWLGAQGLSFAVPAPVPTRDGDTLVETTAGYGVLFPLIPGQPPDREQPDKAEGVGVALGELHRALAEYPPEPHPTFAGDDALERVHPAMPDPLGLTPADLGLPDAPPYAEWLAWWRAEVAELTEFAQTIYPTLPQQMIHGDYGPGNTLWHEGRISAVLDFDFASPGIRALDVASGLRFTVRMDEQPNLDSVRPFWRGYKRWIQPTVAEVSALPTLIRLRETVSTIWWLGRGLAAGTVDKEIRRIKDQRSVATWLAENGPQMEALLQ